MTVGLQVGSIVDEIGTSDFFHAFFSSISFHTEPSGWGSRFPGLMLHLYQGKLTPDQALKALQELSEAQQELYQLPPSAVVWDIEDRSKRPPWGDGISAEIESLGDYFVTSTGRDLFSTLREALEQAVSKGRVAMVVQC